jgi:hypothetical protein
MKKCEHCGEEYEGDECECQVEPEPKKKEPDPPVKVEKIVEKKVIPRDVIEKQTALEKEVKDLKTKLAEKPKKQSSFLPTFLD